MKNARVVKAIGLLLSVFVLALILYNAFSSPKEPPVLRQADFENVEEFLIALQTANEKDISEIIERVPISEGAKGFTGLVSDLWAGKESEYPNLPWGVINSDSSKIRLANILVQKARNGQSGALLEEIHTFVLAKLNTNDLDDFTYILMTLGVFDREEDVEPILQIAQKRDTGFQKASILHLALMCNLRAKEALGVLDKQIVDSEVRFFFEEAKKTSLSLKKGGSWCKSKLVNKTDTIDLE